ncbi:hypothetical protein O181_019765 [Austropuccinia psidii MF-1]|uniref:Uncharacterized protein n=1 Tax=Austropuccinia psidii MF-1 TaxID=1389203 RepID=A0A9Q3CBC0_9BASI|nr:hypothetical protein [Austropuccinia psidii MF-1]
MNTTNRHMFIWKIAIKEYRGNLTIIYKKGKRQTDADGLSRWPLENYKSNPADDPKLSAKILIYFMEIYRKKIFRESEFAPGSVPPDSDHIGPEETESFILVISSSKLHKEIFNAITKS